MKKAEAVRRLLSRQVRSLAVSQLEFWSRFTRPAATAEPFCVWAVVLWLPTLIYRTLIEMILKRGRVLLELGDTMRLLFCLLLGLQVLLSGCGESQEEAGVPATQASGTAPLDEQPKAANELKAAAVVAAKQPDETVAPDETTQPTEESQDAAVAAIKNLGGKVTFDDMLPGKPIVGVALFNAKVIDADLVHLDGMTSLRTLNLSGTTQVTNAGLIHLKGLTSLQSLYLGATKVTDAGLEHLKRLTSLKTLGLAKTEVTGDGLIYLKEMTGLQKLYLHGTQISDSELIHLKGMTNLTSLSLGTTKTTNAGLEHLKGLTNLQELNLFGTRVSDVGLMHLKGLTSLQKLELKATSVTMAGMKELQSALPTCDIYPLPRDTKDAGQIAAHKANELKAIEEAEQTSRTLTNGDFSKSFEGWTIEGEDGAIRLFDRGDKRTVTTSGNRREANTSRLYQCFKVPDDAVRLIFKLHGGRDLSKMYVSLRHNTDLHGCVTANYSTIPREKHFPLTALRGEVVTLEVVDESTDHWGYIGVEDFRIVDESETVDVQLQLEALRKLGARFQRYGNGDVFAVSIHSRSLTNSGMEHLKALTHLRSLDLRGPGITDAGLENIAGLKHLTTLTMSDSHVTDAGLVYIRGLIDLTELRIQSVDVTNAGMVHLKGLKYLRVLHLRNIDVTVAGMLHLKGLKYLSELHIQSIDVTDADLEHLVGLSNLIQLSMHDIGITDAGLERLKKMTHLFRLQLTGINITGVGLKHLRELEQLRSLWLYRTGLTDTDLESLKTFNKLMGLHIDYNGSVTDAGLAHIKGLTNLVSLTLRGTKVTVAGVKDLQSALPKCKISK
jgi:Leucine-rich repeat (LRR) protein